MTTTFTTVRDMFITPSLIRWNLDHRGETPAEMLDSLAVLLAKVSRHAHPAGITVMLDQDAALALGFPRKTPTTLLTSHYVLDTARATGWHVSALSPWMTFWRHDAPSVHIGIMPWLSARNFILHSPDAETVTSRLYRFHVAVGTPYHGANAGLPGLDLLRDRWSSLKGTPMWKPRNWADIPPALETTTEVAPHWNNLRRDTSQPYLIGIDANRQFLAAATHISLASGELVHRRNVPVLHRNLPGYYLIDTPPWYYTDLPHPIGTHHVQVGERRWITAPTLNLMVELAENHRAMTVPDVHEAWTAGTVQQHKFAGGKLLADWAGSIRDGVDNMATDDDIVTAAIKNMYTAGIGMLARVSSRVHRPDWAHHIIALARANLYRRTWQQAHDLIAPNYPAEIDHDAVWYPADDLDYWPNQFPRGSGLGKWKRCGIRNMFNPEAATARLEPLPESAS